MGGNWRNCGLKVKFLVFIFPKIVENLLCLKLDENDSFERKK